MEIFASAYATLNDQNLLRAKIHLRHGIRLAVLGASGSGKTLLLKSLIGSNSDGVRATAKIQKNLRSTSETSLSNCREQGILGEFCDKFRCAYVPQSGRLFPPFLSVGRVLHDLNARRENEEWEIDRQLKQFGFGDTPILNRKPNTFSGGELRRFALIAALLAKPQFMFLDEPTIGLDKQRVVEFAAILKGVPTTNIFATHDLEFARMVATHVVFLDCGEALESQEIEKFLNCPKTEAAKVYLEKWDVILPNGWRTHV